ncbi:MAG TPA: histidine kinase [Casimicrobiaceae bacterium]|nr:histidine kinase [Casimicrobiaceae bacterium]
MLDAVVHFAGASGGAIRVSNPDGAGMAPIVVTGPRAAAVAGEGVLARWCGRCAESSDPTSACVREALCGHDERLPSRRLESVCRHVLVVPLHHGGQQVGMLDLVFDAPCELPAGMSAMLQAAGELIGISLDRARLADEVLRAMLVSERQMMAGEVHDSIAQGLTYMRMRMRLLSDAIRQGDELRAFKYWSDIDDALTNAHARVRELIACFRSQMDPQGLVHALDSLAGQFADRTGVALSFANRAPGFGIAPEREADVFHIVQEALANVARHANASRATMTLDRTHDGYEVVIDDDGDGLSATPSAKGGHGHFGMEIMRERAARLGGAVTVGPAPVRGTRVRLTFPDSTPARPVPHIAHRQPQGERPSPIERVSATAANLEEDWT